MSRIASAFAALLAVFLFAPGGHAAGNIGNIGNLGSGILYLNVSAGPSSARDARFTDDSNGPGSDCFLISTGVGACGGVLNHLGDGTTASAGVGMHLSERLRFELSYSRRNGFDLSGRDPGGTEFDPSVKSDSVMLNGYFDLPFTFGRVRPFVGAGLGVARNKMDPLRWSDPPFSGTLPGGSHTGFAWQATGGLNVMLTDNWSIDFGYRYADMGKFKKDRGADLSGDLFNPSGVTGSATGKLRADEFFAGVRYAFR